MASSRDSLHPALQTALRREGIDRLFSHQAEAVNTALAGRHVVVVTGTASGKTLCYNLPVLEAILERPTARRIYLFPTKALAQDQLRSLSELGCAIEGQRGRGDSPLPVSVGTYDGDTPQSRRGRLRQSGQVILTNPDMLHLGILPNHPLWGSFFRNLRFVVIDEAHTYRGVFGSQVACVLRRLRPRLCALRRRAAVHRRQRDDCQPGPAFRGADRGRGAGNRRRWQPSRSAHLRPLEPAFHRPRPDRPPQPKR